MIGGRKSMLLGFHCNTSNGVNTLSVKRQHERQIGSIGIHLPLGNRSPLHFQVSQCIPMGLDAAADARCVHSLKFYHNQCYQKVKIPKLNNQNQPNCLWYFFKKNLWTPATLLCWIHFWLNTVLVPNFFFLQMMFPVFVCAAVFTIFRRNVFHIFFSLKDCYLCARADANVHLNYFYIFFLYCTGWNISYLGWQVTEYNVTDIITTWLCI